MASHTDGFFGSTFETLESRVMLTGAFPSAAQNAIVYDTKGNLDVAYYDSAAHNLKFVQQSSNGVWTQPVVIDGASSDVGKYVTIAVNGAGFPAVAYQDSANSDLKFAQSNGSSWTVSVADKRKTTGFNPSLTFDSAGTAFVSYYKQNSGDLLLAALKKGKWTLTTLQSAGNVGQFSSIAINPVTGKPAVAYTNAAGSVQLVSNTTKSAAKPVTIGQTTKSTAGSVSLAFGGSQASVGFVNASTGTVSLGEVSTAGKKTTTTTTTIGTVSTTGSAGAQVFIDPTTKQASVVYHDSTGVYVVAPSTQGSGFQTTQVQTGGSDTIAAIQPGSGSLVFSTVDTSGGTLTVNTTVAPPDAPSNVAAAATSPTAATITWTDNSSTEAGFLIERSSDNVTFATVATTQPNATMYFDTGLTEGTLYYYRVSAIGAAGNNSAGTTGSAGPQIVPAAGIATITTLPAAPTILTAAPTSASVITVTWANNSHLLTGFIVNRSTDGGATWAQAGTVGANATTFYDSGLSEGTAFSYQVVAYNVTGGSNSTAADTRTLPAAPTPVSATATSDTSITLSWTNASGATTGFIIQRSIDGTNFSSIGAAGAGATSYDDSHLLSSSAYYYRVVTTGPLSLNSAPSTPANAITNPNAPSNLHPVAQSSSRIDLTWDNSAADTTGYTLQRSASGGAFVTIANPAGIGATHFSDRNLTEGVTYTYRVQAVRGASTSAFSAQVVSTTLPAAPTGLSATANGLSVTLRWADNSTSETGFVIQRSTDGGANFSTLTTTPANGTSTATYVDNTAGQGVTYTYQVQATNAAGASAFTPAHSATIAPAAPSGLTATPASGTEIDLGWFDNSMGETGIYIERSTDNTIWSPVTTTAAFAIGYSDTGLTAGTTYYYRISAVNAGGASTYSTAMGVTSPTAPASLTPTTVSTSEIDLSFPPVNGATSYIIQRTRGGVTTTLNPITTTTYNDTNLAEGTQYQYTVTAVNAGGSSVAGGAVAATTLPAAPINASASDITATSVMVSWANVSNGYTGMLVQRSSNAGHTWTDVGHPTPGQTSITDSNVLEAQTYMYRIQASNAGGASTFSVSAMVTTVPAAPTFLTATATSATNVVLNWNAISQGAISYKVQRGTDGENFTTLTTLVGSANTYSDVNASAATNYYYRVYAIGAAGPSDYSNTSQAKTVPVAPQNVVATPTSATAVSITWNAVTGASGYNVLRSTDGISYSPLHTAGTNGYSDVNAVESTQYWYKVEASNTTGNSVDSTASTPVTTVPSAPSSLTVTSVTAGQVAMSWTNTSHAVTGFSIERSDNNGTSFSPIGTALSTDLTYTDSTVSEGSHYIYRIRATGTGGSSAASNTTGADSNPAAPSGLTTTATSPTAVTISWTNVSTNATGYVLARSDNNGPFNVVATLGSSIHAYNDTVTEDGSYQYQLRAIRLLGDNVTTINSTWSGPQTVTTVPATPGSVNATALSATEVDVTWTNNSPTATRFNISRSNGQGGWDALGSVNAGTSLYPDITAAAGAQYTYQVVAIGPNGSSAPATSGALTAIPPVPTISSASTTNNPHVDLAWSDVAGEAGFDIQRNDGSGWANLASVAQGVTHYTDLTSVENVAYQFRIRATNTSGASAYSSPASASTFLGAPTNVAIASATSTEVDLTWTDHSSAASGYEVQRSTNGGDWQSLTTSLATNATSYHDTTVQDGVSYRYQVRGLSTAGNSDFAASGTTATPVLAPTNLTTTSVSTTRVDLSWTNPSATATSFQIWRSINSAGFVQIDTVSGTSYSDVTLSAGQTAVYEVFATITGATSAASAPATGYARPAAPTNLQVAPVSTTALHLTWTDNSTGATGYDIYRSTGSGFSLLTTVSGANANSYDDTSLTQGNTYTYKVFAKNTGGQSAASNVAENTTLCTGPTSLAASSATASSISLTWTNTSSNADGYAVAMSTDGQSFAPIEASFTLNGSSTSYTVTGLSEATQYYFQVYAYNASGPSANSNTISPTTLAVAPTLASVTAQSDGVHISWTNNSANPGGYIVQRSADGGGTYTQSFPVNVGTTSYVDTSAAANTSYTYQVVTTDAGGNSLPSSNSNALTFPATPTNLLASSPTSSSVHLTWTPDAKGAGGYTISRSNGNGWTGAGSALGADTSFTDNTAVAGTTYTYKLTATNATGSAPDLTSSSVITLTAAPTGLVSTAVTATTVSLTWNDVQGESGFVLQRSPDGSTNWQTIATPSSGHTTYTDTTATEAATFFYRIAGSNTSGTGDYSSAYSALTVPAAPTTLITTPVSATQVNLAWTDHSQAETGYDVYRSSNGGADVRIAHALAAGTTSFQDATANPGYSYIYKVYAYNTAGSSTPATQTALTVPGQPQSLLASAPSSSEIDLTWNSVLSATQYTIQRSPNGTDQWLQVGQVDSNTLSFHNTGLNEGTPYFYAVIAGNATGPGQAATASAPTLPAGVISLSVSSASATQVHLSWVNNSSGATGYHVYRQTNNTGSFNLVDTISDPGVTSFDDTVTEATAYTYRVQPTDASGDGAATDISITTVPATPTLTAVTPASSTTVNLAWTNHSAHATGFTVQRAPFGTSTWSTLTSTLLSSAASYQDATASGGTQYQYKVIAQGAGGNSADSNVIAALTYPAAVSTLNVTTASTTELDLTWTNVTGATGYKILRSTTNSNFVQVDTVGSSATSYQDTNGGSNLTEATRYYYQVVANNGTGDSAAGNTYYTSTLALAPSALTPTVVSATEIDLTWTNNSAHASSVGIERSQNGTTWSQIATTGNGSTSSYHDTGVSAGQTYYYRVSAIDEGGTNYMSDVASVSALTVPDAPTITATAATDGTVSLNWTTPTSATTYTVERSTGGGWSPIVTATSDTSFDDSGLTGNTSYQYRVLASNATGDGAYGTAVSVITVPDAPSALTPVASSTTAIGLTWSGDAGNNVKYSVYRAPVSGGVTGTYVKIGSVIGALTYSDTGLTAGTSYAYEVVASNASGQAVTPAISGQVATFPAAITSLARTIVSGTEVDLTWTGSTGATSYTVSRIAAGDMGYTLLTVSALGSGATSYNDTAASAGISYTYKVTAINASGGSPATIAALTYPAVPTGLTVSIVDNHTISVQWTAVTGATSYTLQRSINSGGWVNVSGVSGTSINDTVAGGANYAYQVKATDGTGDSAYATTTSVTTVPDAVTGVTASATSDTAVHLTWALATGATSYVVKRSDDNGVSYNFTSVSQSSSTTSYDDTGLTELTSYKYEVIAINAGGNAAPNTPVAVVTLPTAPSGLHTTSITSAEVDLAWTDNSNGAAAFDVQRNDGNGWNTIGSTLTGVATYHDTTVAAGSTYSYRILADNGSVISAPGSSIDVLTRAAAPASVVATPINTGEVDLTWLASTSAVTYTILRSDAGGTFNPLDTLISGTSYHDTTTAGGIAYAYEVEAVNATGAGPAGTSNTVTTVPAAPTNLTASGVSLSEVDLAWTTVSGATGYQVERQNPDNSWSVLTNTVPSNAVGYQNMGLNPGTIYTYRVEALDVAGASVPSSTASGFTSPASPTNFVASAVSTTEIDLAWDAMPTATTYDITIKAGNAGYTSLVTGVATNSYNFTTGIAGKTYTFKIIAYNATGASNAVTSNHTAALTVAPTGLTATGVSPSQVNLSWTGSTGATAYEVDRQNVDNSWSVVTNTLPANTVSYHDTGLGAATSYTYRVIAIDAGGPSAASSTASGLTGPAAPTNFVATTVSTTSIDLAWDAMPTATTYDITVSDGGAYTSVVTGVATTSYSFTGGSAGTTYTFQIVANNASSASAVATSNSAATITDAPANLTASSISSSEIDLSWDAVTGATTYQVERYDGTSWTTLGAAVATNSYQDTTGLSAATQYTYRVKAIDAGGTSAASSTSSAYTRPGVSASVTLNAINGNEIDLSWDAVTGATGYRIMRSINSGAYSQVTTTAGTTYNNTGLTEDSYYRYQVIAYNTGGNGQATDPQLCITPVNTPDFVVTGITHTSVSVQWTNHSVRDIGYFIEEETAPGVWTDIHESGGLRVDGLTGSYTITGLTEATSYTFRITASDYPVFSNRVPVSADTIPNDPTALSATPVSPTQVNLSWTNNSAGADTQVIQRFDGTSWSTIDTISGSASTYHDTTGTEATAYQYRVYATKGSSISGLATSASVTTLPLAVTALSATAISATEIDLSWTDQSANPTAYRIYRSTNGTTFAAYGSDLAADATSFNDTNAPENATTYYKVVAVDDGGESAATDPVNATTPLAAPTSVTAATTTDTTTGDKTVNLSWTNASTVATAIGVERSNGGSWTSLTTSLDPTAATYADDSAAEDTAYTYRVYAINASTDTPVKSTHTASNSVTTLLSRPTSLVFSAQTTTGITISWTNISAAATSYTVERSTNGTDFTDTGAVLSGSDNSYSDTGLTAGTTYYYRVAGNSAGNNSNYAVAQTAETVASAPTNVLASSISTSEVDLSWTAVTGATGYEVDRQNPDTSWSALTTSLAADALSYQDTNLTVATQYTYRVKAIDAGGTSAASSTSSAYTRPGVSASVTLNAINGNEIDLSWDAVTGATGYRIMRSINSGAYSQVTTTAGTTYNNTGLTEDSYYRYQVIAYNTGGNGQATDPQLCITPVNTPDFVVTGITYTSVSVQWTNHSVRDIGYFIEEETAPGVWTDIHESGGLRVDGLTGSYTITGLTEATSYTFRITASDYPVFSNRVPVSADTIPNDPTALSATPVSPTQVNLSWTNNSAGADTQVIQRFDGTSWSTIDTISGSASTYHDTTGTEATAYQYRVYATKGSSISGLATSASVTTLPLAVTALSATAISATEIDLSWTDQSANPTAYRIYRSTNGTTFAAYGSDLAADATSFNDTNAPENATTYYKVVAVDDGGESAATDPVNATTPLAAPTSVTAATTTDTTTGDKTVNLSWTNASTVATAIGVERSNGGSWTSLTTSLDPTATTYADNSAAEDTAYTYRVYAIEASVTSTHTASNSVTTLLSRATGLTLASPTATSVLLTWTDVSAAATSYQLERSTNGVDFTDTGAVLSGTDHTYTNTGLAAGTQYYYRLLALGDSNASAYSDVHQITTIPAAPSSFTASDVSAGEVDLSWTDMHGATSYTVERAVGAGSYATLDTGSLGATAHSYADTSVQPGTTYHYRIHASDVTGDSTTSTANALTVPAAITITSATVVSDSEVTLAWTADTGTVDGYRVYRYDANSAVFTNISGDLGSGVTSYDDTSASSATAYIYRVVGFNTTGESGNSDTNSLTTLPTTPANFAASSISSSEIDLSWDAVTGATGYKVERFDGTNWVTVNDAVAADAVSYPITNLTPATQYTYRIEAIDAGGPSVPTSGAAAYTRPGVAATFTATAINGGEIDLAWTAVSGVTGYRIMQSISGAPYAQLTTTANTTFASTGLTENTAYAYKIVAYNAGGNGVATDPQNLSTYLNTPAAAVTGITHTSITVQWTNHSAVDTAYKLEQQTGPSTWSQVDLADPIVVDGDTGSFAVTGLTEATGYTFRVTALGDAGAVSVAATVSASTIPNDPTALNATPVSPTRINLAWTNHSASADTQVVESFDGSTWSPIATIAGDAATYSVTGLTEVTAHQYRVYATKGSSISAVATSASVTTLPLAPTALTSTAVSATEIDLAWTDNSANPTAYRVYRSTDGSTFAPYGSDLAPDATSFQDTSAPENATTYYKVVAVDDGGESAIASTSATTPVSAPTAVTASTTSSTSTGDKTVNLSWTNTSTVATAVKIERSSGGAYSPVATLDPSTTTYADDTALENTTYTYRVYAVDSSNSVASVHTASNTVTTLLSRPTSLTVSSPTATSVALTWTDVSAAATSYHVERSTNGVDFSEIAAVLSGSANSYTDTGRSDDTQYYYRVRAVSGGNTSNYADVHSITTIPATATSVTATPFSTTEIDLSWTDVSTTNTAYTIERSGNGGIDWSVLTTAVTGTATTYSDTGVTEAKDYQYEVIATGAGGSSLLSNVASATSIPNAPTSLALTSSSASSVTVNWTDNSTGAASHEIQRFSGGVWTSLNSSLASNATSYTDSTVAEGTAYQYRVRAVRNGVNSAFAGPLSVTTQPAAPSILAVSSMTTTRVTLTWADNSTGETGFTVERSTNGVDYSSVGTPGANSTTFSDNTVTEGLSYTYYVFASNAGGNSTSSATVTANVPLAAPTGLTTTSILSTSVGLSWTNHSSHQTGFYVERSTNGGVSFSQIADVTSGTTYTDSTTSEATSYQYRVRAYGPAATSSYSSSLSVNTTVNAPTNLAATVVSATELDLTWTDNSGSESGYSLQRSINNGVSWTTTISLAANTTSYHNTGLTEGTTYTYRLQATRTGKNSAFTANQSATTLPASPSSVTAAAASDTQVTVTWTNNSVGATGFTIQRSLNGTTWTLAGTVGGGATTFNDTGLTEFTTYSYRVEATNAGGSSAWSNAASTATTLPAAPSTLNLSAPASDRIQLDWTNNSTAATGYKVERNDGSGWSQIATLGAGVTTYTDLTVNEATQYTYRVRAAAGSLNSAYSNAPSLTTVPLDPDTLTATAVSSSEIDLAWNNNSAGATHYVVERSTDGGQNFSVLVTLDGSATSYQDTGLTDSTDYQYRVRAQDAGGYSGYTSSVDAVTLPPG